MLFTSGAALMLVNSAVVVGIGVLPYPVLRAGLVPSIPGGLFELFFGGWPIARGFTKAK